MKNALAWLCLGLGLSFAAAAEEAEAPDLWTRMEHYYLDTVLNADGTNTRTYDLAYTVLKEQALESSRTTRLSHSTSVEELEILEAYTRKPDGKKIPAPKDNYQINVNSGRAGNAPAFSDRTTVTVIFPEVAVGDTMVLRYKVVQKEAIFPGHFSVRENFGLNYAYDDVRITIDAPASLRARYESQGLRQKVKEQGDRRKVEWTWKNSKPVKSKRRDYSVYDVEKEPGYVYSTFDTYAEIAGAYGARARPKAEPTEQIRKLANEIVGKRKDRREQVRALYDWVSTKVDYAGNCIGVGVVVPRDLSFVLDNKMGDCKDHATLLQALLSAKGIPSSQALVNAGSAYRLPKIPVVSTVNHVINYVPEFDLFLDSTSDSTPMGMLPMSVQDKPVLLVDGFREGFRTPPTPIGSNRQHVKTVVDVAADGSIRTAIDISQNGLYAAMTRDWMRDFPKDKEKDFIKEMLEGGGMSGSGVLKKGDPTALLDTYQYGVTMEIKEFIRRPGAGAFDISPLWSTPAPVHGYVMSAFAADDAQESACSNGSSTEEYTYHLPADMQVLSVPDDLKIANDFLTYEATYVLKGRELVVKRTIDDRTKGNVCGPEIVLAYREFAKKVIPNLKAQVLYK